MFSAEQQIIEALPKVFEAVQEPELRKALENILVKPNIKSSGCSNALKSFRHNLADRLAKPWKGLSANAAKPYKNIKNPLCAMPPSFLSAKESSTMKYPFMARFSLLQRSLSMIKLSAAAGQPRRRSQRRQNPHKNCRRRTPDQRSQPQSE